MSNSTTPEEIIPEKHILYPPGGILIWGLIALEVITFAIAIISLVASGKAEPEAFQASRQLLNPTFGLINTIFLLTSGYFMAASVKQRHLGNSARTKQLLLLTLIGGILFLILKSVEYQDKLSHGLTIRYDTFFTYYWLLTVFHVIHVIAGIIILLFLYFREGSAKPKINQEDYEAGACFWHMCDLIWLLLFPALYLLH